MSTGDTNHWNALKNRALQAADLLKQMLTDRQDSDNSAVTESFTQYAELWQEIANEAYELGLEGLCDVSMLFHASALDDEQVEQGLHDKHGQLLAKWQTLFISYIDAPGLSSACDDLVRYLQDPFWAEPLDNDDVEMLKQQLLMESEQAIVEDNEVKNVTLAEEQGVSGANNDKWMTLKNRATETTALLQKLLADSRDNNQLALVESFTQYAQRWQEIANEAYEDSLEGLCDVCMLFHASALDSELIEQGLDDKHGQLLEKWQELFVAYLDAPEKENTRNDLVRYLQESVWAEPLPDEDVDMLKSMLLPEQIAVEVTENLEGVTDDEDPVLNLHSEIDDTSEKEAKTTIAPDLLELIRTEFEPYAESIFVALESDFAKTLAAEKFELAMTPQLDKLEMLSKVSGSLGLKGLQKVFEVLHDNMQALCSNKLMLEEAQSQILTKVMSDILHYIADIDGLPKHKALAEHLQHLDWPSPLSDNEAQELVVLFSRVSLQSREEIIGVRETASAEDVFLIIQDDVNPELLESLFNELPTLTEEFTEAVQQLLESGSISDVETAQRIAHTLKGSGNLVGLKGIASLTHNIEDIMEKVALHGSVPKGVFDLLLTDCADCLEAMSDHVLGRGDPPDNALTLLQQLFDLTYQIKAEGIPESVEALPIATNEAVVDIKAVSIADSDIMASVVIDAEVVEKAVNKPTEASSDNVDSMTRIPSSLVEDMLRMAGENNILTGQIQQRLRETIEQNQSIEEQNAGLLNLIAELEQLVEEQSNVSQETKVVLNQDFDPLEMDQYNELHTCANRLLEIATDAKTATSVVNSQLSELKDLLRVQERLQKENHELVLQTRMVPVQSIVSRLQRTIRQASRSVGKTVQLHIVGSDTLIDRDILHTLIDSLMHLLRNAVDHGIESSEQRLAAGKSATGNITLEFSLQGSRIFVICQDDGGGLDLIRIRQIAEQKKLIAAGQVLSEQELQRLVLQPGFSTRDSATQLSGRGIGMNAVYDQILKLKGELELDSQFGSGTRVVLALPATLVSVRALLIRSTSQLIAVSNRGLEHILYPGAGKLKKLGSGLAYQHGEKLYSAERFEGILNIPSNSNTVMDASLSAMLFKMETGEIKAILVEQVVDSRELVVKNMGQYVPKIHGVAGATILGDGSVTPVLDIPELMRGNSSQVMVQQIGQNEISDLRRRGHRHALVIDDSLSARRSLALLLSDMDYDVSTAIDGIDAIEKMEEKIPDVILVDLEMPRMNGLELTSHIRNRVDTKDIPVIMVTSRATEKHRQQAETAGVNAYLTKPFSENEMIDLINKAVRIGH